ncbi:MAG: hypothetical protein K5989_03610 [Lachnospiraceae bacterium]|nr:hypothetical protein [Lachnospiraceae bacterium]
MLAFSMTVLLSVSAFAAPIATANGETFDPVYYAQNNPDVVNVLGCDENALCQHYYQYGKTEGRLPCDPNCQVNAGTNCTPQSYGHHYSQGYCYNGWTGSGHGHGGHCR